jgi:small subunit ribosomal protein S2
VHQRINRLKELDEIDFDDVAGSSRTKKELLQMRRERDKLNKSLGGIREMSRTPAAVWIVDTNKEHLAVEEARKLRIPIVGILDSNCDPDLVDFPIPGNDDAIRAVGLLTRVVADAVAEGLIARSGVKVEGAEAGAEEPLADWERELLGGEAEQAAVAATGGDETTEAPAAESTGASTEAAEATDVTEPPVAEAPAAEEAPVAPEAATEEAPAAPEAAEEAPAATEEAPVEEAPATDEAPADEAKA